MGCGSSKTGGEQAVAGAEVTLALSSHVSAILGLPPLHPEIQQYVSALNSEGYNMPADFNDLSVDELKVEPFCFKAGHLKKIARSRGTPTVAAAPLKELADRNSQANVRGKCSLCGMDVLDTQPRLKDPETGLYKHEDCQASRAGPAALLSTPSSTSLLVSERAVSDPKVKAATVSEGADAEVAGIIAAAEAARASGIADAKRRAEESLAAAQNANAKAAAAAAAAEAEVAAIVAAAEAAREAVIAEAKRRAEESLAKAQNDATQIAEAAQFQASMQTVDHETASAASGSTRSRMSAATPAMTRLPAAPKTKPFLPNGKHAFLSYQWDVQEQVKEIKELLNARQVKCWMDIDGGMKSDIYDSMAEGVQGAACVVCFMTQAYQDSANCKLELKFAQQSGVPIIPVMMQANFAAKGWLAILTAGSIWTPMYEKASVLDGVDKLVEQAQHVVPGMRGMDDASDAASEASDNTESFDVGAWGDAMFSLDETREELERLREETAPSTRVAGSNAETNGIAGVMCKLPAMVPTLPRGLFVTPAMQSVLEAVLSDSSAPQIGFCGMGGIGKTTVSCWVTRSDAVRTKFGMVAWVTLGQTPVLDSCIDLLHMQLTGSSIPDGLSSDQKNEHLKQAFLKQSVLLVLDDCWDAEVAKNFTWIDQSSNSKVLISSRVRDVLDGGDVIDVTVPSKLDATKMLLSTAGMDIDTLQERDEVKHIVELCKRLPLTIGVAGKLIRQLSQGSSMSESSDWVEVVSLFEDEMNDPGSSLSVEESVIRASIKFIPKKIQPEVTQLFRGFALAPEDALVPLPVLGMVFDACSSPSTTKPPSKPLSRLQVRRYLKILIDRSLVLGTVDRPQLHDVMLDYVQKELAGDDYKAAQRRFVEALRKADRSASSPTGSYIQQHVLHHITESFDATWRQSKQAVSWLEDHVHGVQDVVAISAATILPVGGLAKEAEGAGMWWQAALRFNAYGLMKAKEGGALVAGAECFKQAVAASAMARDALQNNNADANAIYCSQSDLDMFDLKSLNSILKTWNPAEIATYGNRFREVLATEVGRSQPLLCYGGALTLDWFPKALSGDFQGSANEMWKLAQLILARCDKQFTSAGDDGGEGDKFAYILKPLLTYTFGVAGDAIRNSPGFSWDCLGPNGDKLAEYFQVYDFEVHRPIFVDLTSNDPFAILGATQWILSMQFGRVAEAVQMNKDNLVWIEKIMANPAGNGYMMDFVMSSCVLSFVYHIHGLPSQVQAHFNTLGFTSFENVAEHFGKVTKPMHGSVLSPFGHKGVGGGMYSLTRATWQVKSLYILNMDVPESHAAAWLQSLPDNETILEYMTLPTHDYNAIIHSDQACWIALANEKYNLYDNALRFADLQLETDLLKAGAPLSRWPQVVALACKGRVFAKLNRHDEALVAFQTAIAMSKESYSMMEALAYRELANYDTGGDAAVQARVDLEAKLKTFEGRLTRADFDRLTIGPGPIVDSVDVVTEQVSVVDEQVTGALISHLATVLGVPKDVAIIKQYGAVLRTEGWDTPEDFELLTIDELKTEPFSFKAGHLRKIAMSREKNAAAAAAESQAPVQNIDHETASAASGSTRSRASTAPANTTFLPAAPKTKQLLPNGKHAFLSYQWDVQGQVKEIKTLLNERQVKCWMDIDGGMKSDIYDSMAEGVQGAACVVCFMTQAYQDSANCKLELKFAQQSGVPIIPVMMQANFAAKGWLAILTAGSIWTPMYEKASVLDGVDKLIEQAHHVVPGMHGLDDTSDAASEASDNTESFDVGAWGDAMFSLEETRGELDRLREETAPLGGASATDTAGGATACKIPAMVPTLPRGLFVTAAMQSVLDAVVSDTSTRQIGFCGMGGIGKTTVSCWVARSIAVQTRFGMVAWVTLGQSPVLDSCIKLLHMQLTGGSSLPDGTSIDQKHEFLQNAFLKQSVLLILDDCWDAEVAKHFNWIDQSTNSKLLISSRVRDVLDGGDIIDVTVPSKSDAVKMLLSTAGMDIDALQGHNEVAHIAELCKRLPLTIGVAGKLIRQLIRGSSMSESSDWADVVTLLEAEMNDPDGSLSIEESVIRASIKAIPKKIRPQVTQLFHAFALVPEDMHLPLPVIGMLFNASGGVANGQGNAEPLPRLQVRRYLKILIDRSLVLGTVDRPQLHDVMLDYVQKELAGDDYKAAQRHLVEAFRKADRSTSTPTGRYIQQNVPHHIKESYDVAWERSKQAISWLEDHVGGVQGMISSSAASVLPVEALATEAEAAEMWWEAALRWNACGLMKLAEAGDHQVGCTYFKLGVNASAKVEVVTSNADASSASSAVTQFDLDSFDLYAFNFILKAWDPNDLQKYGTRMKENVTTEAGRSRPLVCYGASLSFDWFPALLSGDQGAFSASCWRLTKAILDMCAEGTEAYALSTAEDRAKAKTLMAWSLRGAGDAVVNIEGFSWDFFGVNGDKLVEYFYAYNYDQHHDLQVSLVSMDVTASYDGTPWILTLQFGRVADAKKICDDQLIITKQQMANAASPGYNINLIWSATFLMLSYHLLGLSDHIRKSYGMFGLTFENAEERLDAVSKGIQGVMFTTMEQKGKEARGGNFALKLVVWHIKSMCILHLNVPQSEAIAWLESLPDAEGYREYALASLPNCNSTANFEMAQPCWIAIAHEKVGMYAGAIQFADLQLEPDPLKAGAPLSRWAHVVALACKGRVLIKLNRHQEALVCLEAAIVASKESYGLMEAFACRELANNYSGSKDAAAQVQKAGVALEAKLSTFNGRMSRAEFETLTIAP